MVLRCLKEDLHLKVEPINFSWSKNVGSNRFDYRWGCDFVAYDYADRISNGVIDFLNRTKAEANALYGNVGLVTNAITNLNNDYVKRFTTSIGAFIDGAESLRSIGQTATGTYEAAKSDVVELWSKVTPVFTSEYSKENILGVLGFETGSNEITEVRTVSFSTIQNALTTPSTGRSDQEDDELGLIISQLTAVSNNVEIIRGSIDRTFFENRITKSNNQEASRVLGEFLSDERNYALISKGYNFSNVEDIVKKTGYDFYTIQKDEDLVIIANKFLGDASRWEILMRINKWRDSRRDENGDYPVPGKKILVPRSIQPITNPYGNKSDTVGFDIKMEFDDIEFTDGDIKLVNGDDNIKQYVKNTLMTKSGEIPGLKSFGLPSLPNVTNVTYGAAVVRESLLRDNRILDVYDINLTVDQDTIIVDCVVQPKNGLSIPVKTIV